MPPKVSDQKRKRGRPPGASKSTTDASNHEAPDHDAEPDPEERARPKKRGRKNDAEGDSAKSGPSQTRNGPAQPRARAGRPPKNSQQNATGDVEPGTQEQEGHDEINRGAKPKHSAAHSKGKRKEVPQIEPREDPESSRPRRSGRVLQGSSSEAPGSDQPIPSQQAQAERGPKRAGVPSSGASKDKKALKGKEKATASHNSAEEDETSAPRRSGRDRRTREPDSSASRLDDEQETQETQATAAPKGRKSRTRPNGASREAVAHNEQDRHPATTGRKKRRGRPSLNNEDSESVSALQPQQGNRAKAPGRFSNADKSGDENHASDEPSQPKRRGRPRQSDAAPEEPEPAQPPRPRGRPRRQPEAADEQEQEQEQDQDQDQEQVSTKTRRKERQPPQLEPVAEEDEDGDEDASSEEDEQELPFRYLKETAKKISRSVISEKWNALDRPSINAVGALVADAQRPVLLRLQNTSRRREHAAAALSGISRRLHAKLVKGFPFPAPTVARPGRPSASGSHEDEFDFERTMNAVQGLENTLNPLLHSIGLLEREIKKEEDALARDYDNLHKLEANARSEVKGWREKAKREHVLAPGIRRKGDHGDYDDEADRLELVTRPEGAVLGGLFKDLGDEELVALSQQIGSHMESMQGNLQQIGGVVPAINRSKAALQQVLLKHLDEEKYDKVLLG